jgi:hypothetical protein
MTEEQLQSECVICLSILEDESLNGVYIIPECKHKFHSDCLMNWFRQGQSGCPLCRSKPDNMSYMDRKAKLSFLRKYALRKEAPELLRSLAKNVREQEKVVNNCKKELRSEINENKDIIKTLRKKKSDSWKERRKLSKYIDTLVGFPILEIPARNRIVVEHQ